MIILTTFARAGYLRRAMDAGARGYVLKDRPAKELADAVRRVHQGLRVVDPELAAEAWGDPDPLTDRERQVLRLAGDGAASSDIALKLRLSEGTVRNYLKRSANWAPQTASKPRESHAAAAGYDSAFRAQTKDILGIRTITLGFSIASCISEVFDPVAPS